METLLMVWNFVVEYRVTVIALVTTIVYIGLKSYVARCEKIGKTDGRFYFFSVTALPFLLSLDKRPGGTGQLSLRVARMEEILTAIRSKLGIDTGPPAPPPLPPPDTR